MEKILVTDFVKHFGSYQKAAETLGCSRRTLYTWKDAETGEIPYPWNLAAQRLLDGLSDSQGAS